MALLFADEDFPHQIVQHLRQLGHDVLTIQEHGLANEGTPDSAVLELAAGLGRIVVTCNRKDFYRLHEHTQNHAGIIVCVRDRDYALVANNIHAALGNHADWCGQLCRVPPREAAG